MSGSKTMILVNPKADLGRAWRSVGDLRPAVEEYGGADWVDTEYPSHAIALTHQAAQDGYGLVIAAGGDGTVHEVINGLMTISSETRPRLGIVPLGSGNDFAQSIGIPTSATEALKKIFTGQPRPIDLGVFEIEQDKREYFDNTFGMGFDATVTIRTHRLTHIHGFMMYLVAVLQTIILNHDAPRMHIVADDVSWEENTEMLVACNGPREGGGFLVAPQAVASDGWLNYAAICRVSRLMMLRMIPEVMNGTHGRFKQVRLGQFRRLQIQSEKPLTIHADGEVICGFETVARNIRVEVIPSAVQLMI
jgi:diacylglycerol kinase (ATP)